MLFWILAGVMTVLAALIVIFPVWKRQGDDTVSTSSDLAVYRDQLRELDADVARGTLSSTEAETSRTEISRRLLAADARQAVEAKPSPEFGSRAAALGLAALLLVGAPLLYVMIGSFGTPDQPLAERTLRPTQEQAELRFAQSNVQVPRALDAKEEELLARLREVLLERPDDLTGHKLLAQTLNSIGDVIGATRAQEEVVRILGSEATSDDFAQLAELLIFAAGGYVSPEADQTLVNALQLSGTNVQARYYSGVSLAQNEKPELAMRLWAGLLTEGAQDAPWKEPIRAQMQALADATGLANPDQGLRGPTQEDINSASEMSGEERQDMIRGMVEGLSDRLATEGGPPAEWARLIRALGVLGDTEQARAIYGEAQEIFVDDEDALSLITEAAGSVALE